MARMAIARTHYPRSFSSRRLFVTPPSSKSNGIGLSDMQKQKLLSSGQGGTISKKVA